MDVSISQSSQCLPSCSIGYRIYLNNIHWTSPQSSWRWENSPNVWFLCFFLRSWFESEGFPTVPEFWIVHLLTLWWKKCEFLAECKHQFDIQMLLKDFQIDTCATSQPQASLFTELFTLSPVDKLFARKKEERNDLSVAESARRVSSSTKLNLQGH